MSEESVSQKLPKNVDLLSDFPVASFDLWKEKLTQDLKGIPYEKLLSRTYEGIDLKPIYTIDDLTNIPFSNDLPGSGSFVRGDRINKEKICAWKHAQEVLDHSKKQLTQKEADSNAIHLTLSRDNLLNINSNIAENEFSISNYENFRSLFNSVDFRKTDIYINAGLSQTQILNNFKKLIGDENREFSCLRGSIESAPLSLLAQYGGLTQPVSEIIAEMGSSFEFIKTNNIELKTIGIQAVVSQNAGASVVEELAFAISEAVEYLNLFHKAGFEPEQILSMMKFTFGTGGNFFMEIAKLRSARMLWRNICDKFEIAPTQSRMSIHSINSSVNKTIFDPYVNMLRSTTETFASIAGGADIITVLPFDKVYKNPDNLGQRIAKNTHVILEEEAHVNSVIDPAGGSYYVENLTKEIAEKSWELFQFIEQNGGYLVNLQNGKLQEMVEETVKKRRADFNKRKSVLVGTNMYANPKETIQSDLLSNKPNNVNLSGQTDIQFLEKAKPFKEFRLASNFEKLRLNFEEFCKSKNEKSKMLLATMGQLKDFKARADFSRAFFEPVGFEILYPNGFDTTEQLFDTIGENNPEVVVICSTDDKYPEIVPEITAKIKQKDISPVVVLAGYPKDKIEEYKRYGIDEFIYLGADVFEINSRILKAIGVEL
ncbi:MAG: hypothetical protein K9J12_00805 [Melioribacteraceae bacterium]|nr:hypothetical protein [Melioribacteraceae bacterium]